MKKIGLGILITITVLALSGITAQALVFVPARVEPSGVPVFVPDVAVGHSPTLKGIQPGTLERTIFIHYANGKIVSSAKTPTCYKLYGIKWKSLPVSYIVNPNGYNESFVTTAISASVGEWDSHTSKTLFGTGSIDYDANWDGDYPDGRNEYSFGDYDDPEECLEPPCVIAVAVVWAGVPIGKGKGLQIIEYDVMFDTDFSWGDATVNPAVMDLQNIAVHESGHGVGLADVYQSVCSAVTMYGYSDYEETQKRTLETPDITGLQKLYGI